MKKSILNLILLLFTTFYYSQSGNNCNLKFAYSSDSILSKQKNFQLEVKNIGVGRIEIFKDLSVGNYQIFDVQKYNAETKKFEDIGYKMKDVQLLPNRRKDFFKLRKNKSHVYNINVEDLTYHARNKINEGYYRFRIFFEYIDLDSCSFSTNYLYYNASDLF